ncbi:peptidase inhibitor family I36 protein [Spirillospora sp. NPDC050679]
MRLSKSLAVTGGLALFACGFAAVPADASARAAASCPSGYVCMWEDAYYGGDKYVEQPAINGHHEIDGWNGDNEISSVVNNTGKCIVLYANDGWSGRTHPIQKSGAQRLRADLQLNGYDNEAESYGIFNTGC